MLNNTDYTRIAKSHGTPIYVYDLTGLKKRLQFVRSQLPKNGHVHFALKANNNHDVLKVIREAGFGVDVVSLGEVNWALESGFSPAQIIFSGVGKTATEIREAIRLQIAQINVESEPELERVGLIAKELELKIGVALRVNPDVDVKTHPYIRTGFRDNKFGVDFSEVTNLIDVVRKYAPHLQLNGLTLHIGSQIREIAPFRAAIVKTLELFKSIKSLGFDLSVFDVGGGLGIDYQTQNTTNDETLIAEYFSAVNSTLAHEVPNIYFEPGRMLVGPFGALITEVQYVKRTPFKNFAIVDTGMHHLMRPSLYQAYHRIDSLTDTAKGREVFDIVGPICESTDVLGANRDLPSDLKSGDYLIVYDVGAYGSVMSSRYNLHPLAKEVGV